MAVLHSVRLREGCRLPAPPDRLPLSLRVGNLCFLQGPQESHSQSRGACVLDPLRDPQELGFLLGGGEGLWPFLSPGSIAGACQPGGVRWPLGTDQPVERKPLEGWKTASLVPFADTGPAGVAAGDVVFGSDRGGSWEDVYTRPLERASPATTLIKYPNSELASCPGQRALLSQEFLWQK